jgi:transcription-repair coupling factor (superfamily II helicase)
MNLSGLLPLIEEVPAYQQLVDNLQQSSAGAMVDIARVQGLDVISSARPYLLTALYRRLGRPVVLLTARAERVTYWTEQLRIWTGSDAVLPFPEPDALPYERVPWARETVSDRLSALTALVRWNRSDDSVDPPLVVASARAYMHKTLPVREFRLGLREYRWGQEIDLQRTLQLWVAHGYRPATLVDEPGTFCRRGGLIDVFPPNLPFPVRIELFGDAIDSLRVFDPTTQRSQERTEGFFLAPATESLPRLAPQAAQRLQGLDLGLCHPPARREYQEDLAGLAQSTYFRGIEFYLPFFYSFPATLLDYLPAGGLCVVDDWGELLATVVDLDRQSQSLQADLVKAGELPGNLAEISTPYFIWEDLRETLQARKPLVLGRGGIQGPPRTGSIAQAFVHSQRYGGQLKRVLDGCQELRNAGQRVVLVSRQAQRISELLADQAITAVPVVDVPEAPQPRSLTGRCCQARLTPPHALC